MADLAEPTIRTQRPESLQNQRSYPFVVATGEVIFPGACVAINLAAGTIEVPATDALQILAGFVWNGPQNGNESFAAAETAMVARGGEVLLTITDVVTTTNARVPVYATGDNDFTITKPASAIAIIGHITEVTQAGEAWVLIDLAEINP